MSYNSYENDIKMALREEINNVLGYFSEKYDIPMNITIFMDMIMEALLILKCNKINVEYIKSKMTLYGKMIGMKDEDIECVKSDPEIELTVNSIIILLNELNK